MLIFVSMFLFFLAIGAFALGIAVWLVGLAIRIFWLIIKLIVWFLMITKPREKEPELVTGKLPQAPVREDDHIITLVPNKHGVYVPYGR